MSLRDDLVAAIDRADNLNADAPYADLADAALAVVRSHVNRLADELRAQAKRERQGLQFDDAFDRGRAEALREAARKIGALCEEQTEDSDAAE